MSQIASLLAAMLAVSSSSAMPTRNGSSDTLGR
eukprot:CAMPEP_0118820338 /NCGR_PEP_ID=MMETSP1162-20130426/7631_1 /TAXON_ID=33656 /ORGANISM="Phaeocystis Sp, Strain CCMP2710" /LENGTH=32 /DNA_ID= /DNA_START= /DNA_END= /DNA_ORIENTATION=